MEAIILMILSVSFLRQIEISMILSLKKQLPSIITENYLDECLVEGILVVNINYSFINIEINIYVEMNQNLIHIFIDEVLKKLNFLLTFCELNLFKKN